MAFICKLFDLLTATLLDRNVSSGAYIFAKKSLSNLKLKQFNFGHRFDKQECQNSEKDNSDTSPVY